MVCTVPVRRKFPPNFCLVLLIAWRFLYTFFFLYILYKAQNNHIAQSDFASETIYQFSSGSYTKNDDKRMYTYLIQT